MEQFRMVAKTLQGLEDVLATELEALGAQDTTKGLRMVEFTGDKEMMYKANFCLRTALRILKPIKTFTANDADGVYEAVRQIEWSDILDLKTSFAVDSVVYSEDFKHSKFVAYKVKDAIVDYFRDKTGQRPNISIANPDIRLNIHISGNDCTLSLDSSGESLHKRGYKVATVESPINEVLAAGMILTTGWDCSCDFIDPMCGSGTIAIEAALIARNIYPGVFHTTRYAFENWKDFDPELLEKIYNDDSQEREFSHKIYASDIDPAAVSATNANARAAGVSDIIEVEKKPIQQFTKPSQKAIMVTNPPYGERLTSPDLAGLYRTIGEKLKHQFSGNDAWVISYKKEIFDCIGLRPSVSIPLYNGSLNCEFRKYQIFDGVLKDFRSEGGIIKSEDDLNRMRNKKSLRPHRDRDDRGFGHDGGDGGDIPAYLIKRHRNFLASPKGREVTGERRRFDNGDDNGFGRDKRRRDDRRDDRRRDDRRDDRRRDDRRRDDWRKDDRRRDDRKSAPQKNRSPWAKKDNFRKGGHE